MSDQEKIRGNIIEPVVHRLMRSKLGEQVLRDFYAMIENGAISLDSSNWQALRELVNACSFGYAGSVRDAIADKLKLSK